MPTKRAPIEVSTTSAAILGLLAVQEGTAYDLARRMERNHGFIWPRAASKLYEEVRRLESLGLIEGEVGATGKRPRTLYRIRAEGLAALRAWAPRPSAPPTWSFEALVHLTYADFGTVEDARAQLRAVREHAQQMIELGRKLGTLYVNDEVELPERAHTNVLVWRFLGAHYLAMRDAALAAEETLDAWDGTAPSKKNRAATRRAFAEGLRLLERRAKR